MFNIYARDIFSSSVQRYVPAWLDVKKILKRDGAQDRDLKSPKDLFRLFPSFLLTDSRVK